MAVSQVPRRFSFSAVDGKQRASPLLPQRSRLDPTPRRLWLWQVQNGPKMSCAPTEGVEVDFIVRISKFLMLDLVLRFFRVQLTNKRMRLVKVCLILLMEEIRLTATSWYGTYPHYLQGFIHVRWCRISSINSISSTYQYIHEKKLNSTTFLHVSVQWEVSHLHLSCFRPSNKVTDGLPIFSKLKGQNQPRLTGTS